MNKYDELFSVMMSDEEKFLLTVQGLPERENRDFYLYAGAMCYQVWEEKYDEVYAADNVRDIAIWMRDNMRKSGKACIAEHAWVRKSLVEDVVRLGRLQFEKTIVSGKGDVLNIHIPEDGPLLIEDVAASLKRAEEFFSLSDFICSSWLLSPDLKPYLDENSNIRRFQELFDIVRIDYSDRQAEERVFGNVLEDITKYKTETDLQKKLRDGLIKNGNPGVATGFIKKRYK